MKIVIIGGGKLGFTLTQQLAQEDHDIVVIDNNPEALAKFTNALDIISLQGNAVSVDVLKEAGIGSADLVIAVTSGDETNIICCLLARKLGVKYTVARIRNPEYSNSLYFIKDDLGLSLSVNPELEAATAMSRLIRFPSAMKIDFFAKGRVEIVEFKVNKDSRLIDMPLYELPKIYGVKLLVCAVQRGNEVFIPGGDFTLAEGDKVSITGSPQEIASFFQQIGILKKTIKTAMLIGGGKIGYYLAKLLLGSGIKVKIIEMDRARCLALSESLPKAIIIQGDGSDQEILMEEGIDEVDAFVALTNFDEENVIMSMFAVSRQVDKVITKVNRQSFSEVLENLGLDSMVSPRLVSANKIIRYVRALQNSWGSSVEAMTKIVNQQVEALEFRIREDCAFLGVPLKDIPLKPHVLIARILRGSQLIIPNGNDILCQGDNVIVITKESGFLEINDILNESYF